MSLVDSLFLLRIFRINHIWHFVDTLFFLFVLQHVSNIINEERTDVFIMETLEVSVGEFKVLFQQD